MKVDSFPFIELVIVAIGFLSILVIASVLKVERSLWVLKVVIEFAIGQNRQINYFIGKFEEVAIVEFLVWEAGFPIFLVKNSRELS